MKIKTQLENQLQSEFSKDAQDCLKIYQWLIDNTGHVWSNDFDALVHCCSRRIDGKPVFFHRPTKIGEVFLKALDNNH